MLKFLPLLFLLAACGMMPSEERIFNPDEEFAKLDGPDVPTVQASLRKSAEEAVKKNDYDRAAGLYRQLIDHDPKNMDYKLGFAESLRRLGEYKPSIHFYTEVTKSQPKNVDALEGKALSLMGNGDTEEAAKAFKDVLQYDRSRWRTYNALGILFSVKGMYKESRAYLAEALNKSPDNSSVLNNIALVDAMQKRYTEADKHFAEASRGADAGKRVQIDLNHALVKGVAGDMNGAEKLASKHLSQAALENNLGLYAHLAHDEDLARSYLNMALSGTSVYYKKAWENLDIIAEESDGKKKKY